MHIESPPLSTAAVHELLAHRRRHTIVRLLEDGVDPIPCSDLVELIVDREHDSPTAEDRYHVLVGLHHNHLPRLDDAGVIDYDHDHRTIRRDGNFDELVRAIENRPEAVPAFAD